MPEFVFSLGNIALVTPEPLLRAAHLVTSWPRVPRVLTRVCHTAGSAALRCARVVMKLVGAEAAPFAKAKWG